MTKAREDSYERSEEVSRLKIQLQEDEVRHLAEVSELKHDVAERDKALKSGPSRSYVDGLKRDLKILKKMQYNASGDDDEDDEGDNFGAEEGEEEVESVLLNRCRRLEGDLIAAARIRDENGKVAEERLGKIKALEAEKEKVRRDRSREVATYMTRLFFFSTFVASLFCSSTRLSSSSSGRAWCYRRRQPSSRSPLMRSPVSRALTTEARARKEAEAQS